MQIRVLVENDMERLHELYNRLVERVPCHPRVSLPQFREELRRTTSIEREGVFLPAGDIALVAERHGALLGLAMGAFLQEKGKYAPAATGLVRFVMSLPWEEEACRQLIHGVVEHLQTLDPERVRAMPYWYGPVFYNTGCGRLTGAWPWVGHALMREGFDVLDQYGTEVRMRRRIRSKPLPPELPEGAQIRPATTFGYRAGPEFEHTTALYLNGERAAECRGLYSENFVRGTGNKCLYIDYVEVQERFKGRGLGRVMVQEALCAAYDAGATESTLTADATNFAAMNLYRSENYEPIDLLFEFDLKPEAGALAAKAW